jgi:hypothetical protein
MARFWQPWIKSEAFESSALNAHFSCRELAVERDVMAECAYYGTETQLFENGKPICVRCDSTRSLISEVRKSSKRDYHGGASEELGNEQRW